MKKILSKRFMRWFILLSCLSGLLLTVLNLPVTSLQGVNYQLKVIKMPLYIKIFEFLDRHYHYQELVNNICRGLDNDQDRVLAILAWVNQNIRKDIPQGWPIIDDHAWHIVIRGYGAADQFSDIFATLCNYAGIDAFFKEVSTADKKRKITFSFVKIDSKWRVFDPYQGSYFKNQSGELADIDELRAGSGWLTESLDNGPKIDYALYFSNLPYVEDIWLCRPNIQSPVKRLLFELKKISQGR